jgi:hypothetical protein
MTRSMQSEATKIQQKQRSCRCATGDLLGRGVNSFDNGTIECLLRTAFGSINKKPLRAALSQVLRGARRFGNGCRVNNSIPLPVVQTPLRLIRR